MVEPDRPQMTIWRMCIACWIPEATGTHLEYAVRLAFLGQKWLCWAYFAYLRPTVFIPFG